MNLSLVEDWPFPLFRLEDGVIRFANLSAQEWMGDSLRRLQGRRLSELVRTEPGLEAQLEKSRSSGTALTTRDTTVHLPRGGSFTSHVTI